MSKAIVVETKSGAPSNSYASVRYVAELNKCQPGSSLRPCVFHAVLEDARYAAMRYKVELPQSTFEVYVLDGEAVIDAHYVPQVRSGACAPPR